ncbi:MAG TPA: D-alanyl-lipoteichoic acid biosynthesis protein DltD [Bacteroidia bacterium]|nr:D-alanyl-lipoteichoic acid biosynthesis protein DltD [Bacteroidia bacterium]
MKKLLLFCIIPFAIALLFTFQLTVNPSLSNLFFSNATNTALTEAKLRYIENFSTHPEREATFLTNENGEASIYLLGSSELATNTEAIPYNFIPSNFNTQVTAIGHAGNQCLSIYTQLLANSDRLQNTPIVIILSPGWFESKAAKGTSSALFLEFNSENFLQKTKTAQVEDEFKSYLNARIASMYPEFSSPHLQLKRMYFEHQCSKSLLHALFFKPLLFITNQFIKLKKINPSDTATKISEKEAMPPHAIAWDSLLQTSKQEVEKAVTNNELGIADDYYSEYIHGKTGKIQAVETSHNQELQDCKMLIKLLKSKHAHASFIISPLNALYYKNCNSLSPVVSDLENELTAANFPYLNLFEGDAKKYDKALLHDVMHLSDYGWYKVDKFILETYSITK